MPTQRSEPAEIIEGLNVFRALEAWGATLYAAWAEHEADARLAAGHLIIAEREATHARLLAERLRSLGAEPAAACVDAILEGQLAELRDVRGFVAQLDALKRVSERDAERMTDCRRALDRGLAAAEATDRTSYALLKQLYGEEKVSAAWYRRTYGELTGRHPLSAALPVLTPAQVVRRALSAAATDTLPATAERAR
jgi:rubrerythrin